MFSLQQLVRKNIWELAPYSSARDEYSGKEARVFLDANENPYNTPYNRYPDPLQRELKSVLKKVKGVPENMIFLGNGSDEAIDIAYRVFCNPDVDNVVAIAPTYGMYKVCADINAVEYRTVLLDDHFQFSADKLLAACDAIDAENKDGSQMIKKDVVTDIISFIRVISKADAAERVQLFKTMYLDGDYEDTCDSADAGSAVPSSFDKLCRLDNSMLKSSGMKTAALYIAFIVELGKYYLHSRYDKGSIDQQKYLDYIKARPETQSERKIP